jgi:hypothetical protein
MNDLSFLRAPYIQNFFINFMVEIPSIPKKENSSVEEKLSWRDIQGLSLTFEEPNFELNEKFPPYAQA